MPAIFPAQIQRAAATIRNQTTDTQFCAGVTDLERMITPTGKPGDTSAIQFVHVQSAADALYLSNRNEQYLRGVVALREALRR